MIQRRSGRWAAADGIGARSEGDGEGAGLDIEGGGEERHHALCG
jgi:hypothetical protein